MDFPLNKLPAPKYDKKTIGNKPVIEVKFVEKIDNLSINKFPKKIFRLNKRHLKIRTTTTYRGGRSWLPSRGLWDAIPEKIDLKKCFVILLQKYRWSFSKNFHVKESKFSFTWMKKPFQI